jgi:hypothetical protein
VIQLWPADRTAMLRRLLRQGLTDPEIAEALGVTVRAVLGKRRRLALPVNPRRPRRVPVAIVLPALEEQEW